MLMTWDDIGTKFPHVMLIRPPVPSYQWLYKQLHGTWTPRDAVPQVINFGKLVLGSTKRHLEPWHTLACQRQRKVSARERRAMTRAAQYLQRKLPPPAARISHIRTEQPCQAVVQLRGAKEGPEI